LEGVDLRDGRFTDLARGEDLLDATDHGIKPPIVSDAQRHASELAGLDHPFALVGGHRHRLFAKDALARFSRSDGLLGVQVNRSGDVNGVNLVVGDQLAPIAMPALRAEFIRKRPSQVNARSTDGDEFAYRSVTQSGRDPFARDVAASDQSPSKFFHGVNHYSFALLTNSPV